MSKASELNEFCNKILSESNFMLVDGKTQTTIAGDTDSNKMVVRSEGNKKITKEDVKRTIDDFKTNLNVDKLDDISKEMNSQSMK